MSNNGNPDNSKENMGLEAFDIAPDNRGGRKPSKPDDNRTVVHDAHTEGKCSEEYWRQLLNKHGIDGKPEGNEMNALCGETHLRPESIKQKLHEYEIFEYEHIKEQELERAGLEPDTDSSLVSFIHDATK